jgi:hypothetical protein
MTSAEYPAPLALRNDALRPQAEVVPPAIKAAAEAYYTAKLSTIPLLGISAPVYAEIEAITWEEMYNRQPAYVGTSEARAQALASAYVDALAKVVADKVNRDFFTPNIASRNTKEQLIQFREIALGHLLVPAPPVPGTTEPAHDSLFPSQVRDRVIATLDKAIQDKLVTINRTNEARHTASKAQARLILDTYTRSYCASDLLRGAAFTS